MIENFAQREDDGTLVRVTIVEDVDGEETAVNVSSALAADSKLIYIKDPNGETSTYDAEFYTDGSDGIIETTLAADDLVLTGVFTIQARVILADGTWHTRTHLDGHKFRVYGNLTD